MAFSASSNTNAALIFCSAEEEEASSFRRGEMKEKVVVSFLCLLKTFCFVFSSILDFSFLNDDMMEGKDFDHRSIGR